LKQKEVFFFEKNNQKKFLNRGLGQPA